MRTAPILSALALTTAAHAAVIFTGAQYSENFNGLPTASVSPSPFSATVGQQFTLDTYGVAGWSIAKIGGTATTSMPFTADIGDSSGGGIHSYGPAGSGERALGALASGTNIAGFGFEVVNNASFTITDLSLSFDREMWRSSTTAQNTLAFAYGTSAAGILSSDFLTNAGLILNTAGDLVGLTPVSSNGAVDGNAAPNSAGVSVAISGLSVLPGQSLFFRWTDVNDGGNDAGLAIDNFTFNATPAPGAVALLGLGALIAGRRKR